MDPQCFVCFSQQTLDNSIDRVKANSASCSLAWLNLRIFILFWQLKYESDTLSPWVSPWETCSYSLLCEEPFGISSLSELQVMEWVKWEREEERQWEVCWLAVGNWSTKTLQDLLRNGVEHAQNYRTRGQETGLFMHPLLLPNGGELPPKD